MTWFTTIADIILDALIVAAAGYLLYLAGRHLWNVHVPPPNPAEPVVDPRYWDVLAETRTILEQGV